MQTVKKLSRQRSEKCTPIYRTEANGFNSREANTRYYDPMTGRFISMDDVEYIDPETIGGTNLFAYCNNNPVMNADPNGTDWSSFWRGVGNWFGNTFGAFVDVSYNIVTSVKDFLFFGYETGVKAVATLGNNLKPISFFATKASDMLNFWENKIGLKINIGEFNASFAIGLGEVSASIGWKNTNMDFEVGINKIGIGISHTKNDVVTYSQVYVRTWLLALADNPSMFFTRPQKTFNM